MAGTKEVKVNYDSLAAFTKVSKSTDEAYVDLRDKILASEADLKDNNILMGPIAENLNSTLEDYAKSFHQVRLYFNSTKDSVIDNLNSYKIDDDIFAKKFTNASKYKNIFESTPTYTPPEGVSADQADFINKLIPGAMKVYKETGIYPSVTISQACKETGFGKYLPGGTGEGSSNNYFGIKATPGWKKVVKSSTGEHYNGKDVTIVAGFRAYDSLDESVADYGKVIGQKGISAYENACKAKTPEEQIRYIGPTYATGPGYAESAINDYMKPLNLKQLDPK